MARFRVTLIGESGPVSTQLQAALTPDPKVQLSVLGGRFACAHPGLAALPEVAQADIAILCVQDFASPQLVEKLPPTLRLLDISPAFRLDPAWVYGLPELPGQAARIQRAHRTANPGCFATAAILAITPLQRAGLLRHLPTLYLDGTGGYSTGGAAMAEKAAAGTLDTEAVFSLQKQHRHVPEVQAISGFDRFLWFSPKIANVPQGIRLQIPLPYLAADTARAALREAYAGTQITVSEDAPNRISVDHWAGRPGACLYVIPKEHSCSVICTLDNLRKGAADAALDNLRLMLTGDFDEAF